MRYGVPGAPCTEGVISLAFAPSFKDVGETTAECKPHTVGWSHHPSDLAVHHDEALVRYGWACRMRLAQEA